MSRFSKIITIASAALIAAACTTGAKIEGTLEGAPSKEVVVRMLDMNRYVTLDTLKVNEAGAFSYKVEIEKGQPEFIYMFHNDTKIASLLLEAGDNVKIITDTLGNCSIEGSEESVRLTQIEKAYGEALVKMADLAEKAQGENGEEYRRQLGKEYVDYYRNSVRYVMENSHSLTVVPVFFQYFGADLPVFSQSTDAIHFRNVSDSLETVYPDSKYVKALRTEAERRFNFLELQERLSSVEPVGYPDIELPDLKAQKRKLSEVEAKTILVYFWSAAEATQKMFNLDVLKPLYEDFHKKGFEIYAVSLDTDKTIWAQVVKEQNLPWINVCDSRGAASSYVTMYNIGALPAAFIINDGELVDGDIVDEASLRNLIKKLLK